MNIFCRLLKRNIYTNSESGDIKAQSEQGSSYKVIFQQCPCLIFENVCILRAVQLAYYGGS